MHRRDRKWRRPSSRRPRGRPAQPSSVAAFRILSPALTLTMRIRGCLIATTSTRAAVKTAISLARNRAPARQSTAFASTSPPDGNTASPGAAGDIICIMPPSDRDGIERRHRVGAGRQCCKRIDALRWGLQCQWRIGAGIARRIRRDGPSITQGNWQRRQRRGWRSHRLRAHSPAHSPSRPRAAPRARSLRSPRAHRPAASAARCVGAEAISAFMVAFLTNAPYWVKPLKYLLVCEHAKPERHSLGLWG